MVVRFDFQKLPPNGVPIGGGALAYNANLTRVGVFDYDIPGRGRVRELRPPEEVFNPDSLASANLVTLTHLHPAEGINPGNWKAETIGTVAGPIEQDGKHVRAKVVVRDSAAQKNVGLTLTEISMGYTADLDWTPGEWEGQRYDCVQRNIRYNHAALGPDNWGRLGSTCALRLDGQAQIQIDSKQKVETMKITVDGIEYEVGTPACDDALARQAAKADRVDAAEKTTAAATAKADSAAAEAATFKAEAATFKADAAKAESVRIVSRAAAITGKAASHFDGKADAEVMTECIKLHNDSTSLVGVSPGFLAGMFAGLPDKAAGKPQPKSDSVDVAPPVVDTAEAAREQMIKDSQEAWKLPLLYTKGQK